jgi:hypothetical protein
MTYLERSRIFHSLIHVDFVFWGGKNFILVCIYDLMFVGSITYGELFAPLTGLDEAALDTRRNQFIFYTYWVSRRKKTYKTSLFWRLLCEYGPISLTSLKAGLVQ